MDRLERETLISESKEIVFTDPEETNRKIYENACKKFHLNPEKNLFSWQLKKVFNEYVDNGGFVGLMSFSTPSQIQSYAYINNSSFWHKFWAHG